ncbi:MAG TPA: YfhO family protein [Bryobacteraceae bacterium]|nr:YfhO family protein [Bryobacteraceae bacterium]
MLHRRSAISVSVLLLLTGAIYIRPSIVFGNQTLPGADYFQLHIRHMAFARDALFGPLHFLPAWYPRELFGAPFSANLQTFPWIPTRLILLLFDPVVAYAAGVALAALLAALFTYLYCRRVGISEIGSVAAGWTFACAGFFASRVLAGHLPLLEAYPSLPLLLWLADRAISPDRVLCKARDLIVLALATACVAVAGHPQLPVYSIATAMLYAMLRSRGWLRIKVASAMILGIGATMAAWWPMLLLVQRSSRMLSLAPASNDIAMPYGRLFALIKPGVDGWPDVIPYGEKNPFHGYPHDGYFWDTASYTGLLPLFVVLALLILSIVRRRLPPWPWWFLAALGSGALLFSLPLADPIRQLVPGTFLRSPARLLYLSTFSASVALGYGVHAFLSSSLIRLRVRYALVGVFLAAHFLDLGGFARVFIQPVPRQSEEPPEFWQILAREVKDGRIAAEDTAYRDRYDDVGIFDSILLANPYRTFLALAGLPPDTNEQRLEGSALPLPALQASAVRIVITSTERPELEKLAESEEEYLYRVPNSSPRSDAAYSRPSSDEIHLETNLTQSGFVHVIESDDPGWAATVDGIPTKIDLANGFAMAIQVPAGKHEVQLRYKTPGRRAGLAMSLLSVALLACLILYRRPSAFIGGQ